MRALAVVNTAGEVVEVCGSRLAIYPKCDAALDVVRHEARMAGKDCRVAEVIIVVAND